MREGILGFDRIADGSKEAQMLMQMRPRRWWKMREGKKGAIPVRGVQQREGVAGGWGGGACWWEGAGGRWMEGADKQQEIIRMETFA